MDIKDLAGLSQPITKFIEVCSTGLGRITNPRMIRKNADARVYEIEKVTQALIASKEKLGSQTEYENGEIKIIVDKTESSNIEKVKIIEDNKEDEIISVQNDINQRVFYKELKKEKNINNTINFTMNELENETKVSEEEVDEDWITRFFNTVEDINNEKLQQLWGRILAGEIKKPNSYSLRTLELLKNLSFNEAELFSKVGNLSLSNTSKNSYFILSDKEKLQAFGISFSDLLLLQDLDLLHPNELQFNFNKPTADATTFILYGKELINIDLKSNSPKISLQIYKFTRTSEELLNLINRSVNIDYLKLVSEKLKIDGTITVSHCPILNEEGEYHKDSLKEL